LASKIFGKLAYVLRRGLHVVARSSPSIKGRERIDGGVAERRMEVGGRAGCSYRTSTPSHCPPRSPSRSSSSPVVRDIELSSTNGQQQGPGRRDARQVPWAGYIFDPIAIHREVPFHVDFLRISKENSGWILIFQRKMEHDKTLMTYRGTYRFHLVAVADNAQPEHLNVDVDYNGDWNNLRAWRPSGETS
jgi:hypothetical protein